MTPAKWRAVAMFGGLVLALSFFSSEAAFAVLGAVGFILFARHFSGATTAAGGGSQGVL
jgi:hypothetical protein